MNLVDTAALVSGGASGLGAATVRALHARGAHVVVLDRELARAEALAAELGARVHAAAADVTDEAAVRAAVARATALAPLRAVVTCAGVGAAARVLDRAGDALPLAAFQRVIDVNLVGTFNVVRLAVEAMAKQPALEGGARGAIVLTASIAAEDGQVGQAAYSASKAGIAGMTLPLARELARHGIRVCTVCPGTMDTPLLAGLPAPAREELARTIPFPPRLGEPSEFAALALHVLDNAYLNGATLRLDGALRMGFR